MMSVGYCLLAAALLAASPPVRERSLSRPAQSAAARPEDVATMDAILAALYDVISGPAGQRRNWDRMRSLFAPGARLIPAVYRPDSVPTVRVWDVEQYISQVGPRLEATGFFEREIARRSDRYGGVVHVFSTYESRRAAADPAPFARGINSIQLLHDGRRWWIVTIYWEGERPGNPIPPEYLKIPGKETAVTVHANGTFEVKLAPQPTADTTEGSLLGRLSIDKQFHGDLEATSKGEMLTAGTGVKGSAGYVAIERVSGTLHGKRGTFVLQHTGTMNRGAPELTITVVPDSGTGQLGGLSGRMVIRIADGKHFYELEYTLAGAP